MKWGEFLKEIINRAPLKKRKLLKLAGISFSSYYRWIREDRIPDGYALKKICNLILLLNLSEKDIADMLIDERIDSSYIFSFHNKEDDSLSKIELLEKRINSLEFFTKCNSKQILSLTERINTLIIDVLKWKETQ